MIDANCPSGTFVRASTEDQQSGCPWRCSPAGVCGRPNGPAEANAVNVVASYLAVKVKTGAVCAALIDDSSVPGAAEMVVAKENMEWATQSGNSSSDSSPALAGSPRLHISSGQCRTVTVSDQPGRRAPRPH
jgi:hypothetical protein